LNSNQTIFSACVLRIKTLGLLECSFRLIKVFLRQRVLARLQIALHRDRLLALVVVADLGVRRILLQLLLDDRQALVDVPGLDHLLAFGELMAGGASKNKNKNC
jgi:hypothetical protein